MKHQYIPFNYVKPENVSTKNARPAILAGLAAQPRQTTNFTRSARCGAVAPRVLSRSAAKIADGAQAGRLLLRAAASCSGHKMACGEDASSHFVG